MREIRQAEIQSLRDTRDATVDQIVVENYLSLPSPDGADVDDEANDDGEPRIPHRVDYASPAYQDMARRMGRSAYPAPLSAVTATTPTTNSTMPTIRPTLPPDPYAAPYGSVNPVGLLLHFPYLSFTDPPEG